MPLWTPPGGLVLQPELAHALYVGGDERDPTEGLTPLEAQRRLGVLGLQLPDGNVLEVDLQAARRLGKGDQARVAILLKEIESKILFNPLLSYRPASCRPDPKVPGSGHPRGTPCTIACKHAAFHLSIGHPLRAFFGGNRAGKTTTSIIDDIIQMTPPELLPPDLWPYKRHICPFYCRVMTPDMQRTMVPVIYEKLRQWLPKELLKEKSFERSFDKQASSLRLECGCRFDFLSYEMGLDKFGGTALHRAHYDETPPSLVRKECLMRLIDYGGDELFSLTPLGPLGFTFKEIWKKREERWIYAVKVSIDDNPTLNEGTRRYVAQVLSADEREAATRLHGDFMHESGLVYPGWRLCLRRRWSDQEIRDAENVVAIDPGIRFAGIAFIAFDRFNHAHVWKAVKLRDAVAEDYANEIKSTLRDVGVRLGDVDIVTDPAAVARSAATGETVMDELGRYDILADKADNDVKVGITGLRRRMRNDLFSIADPEAGAETEALTDELEEYVVLVDEDSDDGEFKVVKTDDHVCDAVRYGIQRRPWLPEVAYGPEDRERAWYERDDPRAHVAMLRALEAPEGSVMGDMA